VSDLAENLLSKYKRILFDLDGTLIDSKSAILSTLDRSLKKHNIESVIPLTDNLVGPPLKDVVRLVSGEINNSKMISIVNTFKAYYDTTGYKQSSLFPNILSMLTSLSSIDGRKMYIVTNKRANPTRKILKYLSIDNFFIQAYSLDTLSPEYSNKSDLLKQVLVIADVKSSEAIYVGDLEADFDAAKESGLDFLKLDHKGLPKIIKPGQYFS
jgi:phosphoglycolate phosphatase